MSLAYGRNVMHDDAPLACDAAGAAT